MSKNILVVPDPHAHPDHPNDRADYLGQLIVDIKPDIVVNIGDGADMPSLASYDKNKRSFYGKTYAADINSHLDFQDRMWSPMKKTKKKMPESWYFIGNHEQRIERALDLSPELQGTVGYKDLALEDYYDEVVHYEGDTPGIRTIQGIAFAHYFISGVMGKSIGGQHMAHSLLTKNFKSSVQGHNHTLDFCERTDIDGNKIQGLVCGVYQDYNSQWAGARNNLWWRGVTILNGAEGGRYDLQCISLAQLKKEYS